jgi:hypothetical protein
MPNYDWTCLACGCANEAHLSECLACSCPASASFKQITTFREGHVARGGSVLAGAGKLPEEGDYEILGIFSKIFLCILGVVSFASKKK